MNEQLASLERARTASAHRNLDIEAALSGDVGVYECVANARMDEKGEHQWIAYVVPTEEYDDGRLRERAVALLPGASQPRAYVTVTAIPLTDVGEVDWARLDSVAVVDDRCRADAKQAALRATRSERVTLEWEELRLPAPRPLREATLLRAKDAAPAHKTRPAKAALAHGPELDVTLPQTLPEMLRQTAVRYAEKGLGVIRGVGAPVRLSYPELLEEAEIVAGALSTRGVSSGSALALVCNDPMQFLIGFWGAVLLGAVPIPVSVPLHFDQTDASVRKLQNAIELLEISLVVAGSAECEQLGGVTSTPVASVERLRAESHGPLENVSFDPDAPALMLLTSGSTGIPKAVQQSHRALLNQTSGLAKALALTKDDISLNWFALDHVGGLVMFHLRDAFSGTEQLHGATGTILAEPLLWLDWLEAYHVSVTWAPNFAFGLVTSALSRAPNRRWDLSRMRAFINGGEAIARRTAQAFIDHVVAFGASASSMRPVWGMSETCSAATVADWNATVTGLVSVGKPLSGASLRIVDFNGDVTDEGVIGRLQVRGASVTLGYYGNRVANAEVFTLDGWFDTGDLGLIENGELTVTGRAKDIIVINGGNIYCSELESVVEAISLVLPSFVAAVPMRGEDTEQVAVFFSSDAAPDAVEELNRTIRRALVQSFGINPRYVLPIPRSEFPKTAIGKIQRSALSSRLSDGEFDSLIELTGQRVQFSDAIPDWFFRRRFHPRRALHARRQVTGQTLVFADSAGLASSLTLSLGPERCIWVEHGPGFAVRGARSYQIDALDAESYAALGDALRSQGPVTRIVHAFSYGERPAVMDDGSHILGAHALGYESVVASLRIIKAGLMRPREMWVFSSDVQNVGSECAIAYERATLLGLAGTVNAEFPELDFRHVDLAWGERPTNPASALEELSSVSRDVEVAYRAGRRYVPTLERVEFTPQVSRTPLREGGCYLITGGLGGVGYELARYLAAEVRCRLLVIGRTNLQDCSNPLVGERLERLAALRSLGSEVEYAATDIANLDGVRAAIVRAEGKWNQRIEGAFHLAGAYTAATLCEQTFESLRTLLAPKLLGSWVLERALARHPNAFVVHASSLVALFRGAGVGGYAAANNFVEAFAASLRHTVRPETYCLSWSLWDEIGMSRGTAAKSLMQRQGYMAMSSKQALSSLRLALATGQHDVYVGIDGQTRNVLRFRPREVRAAHQAVAYYPANGAIAESVTVSDSFGTPFTCTLRPVDASVFRADGSIDRGLLTAERGSASQEPLSQTEEILANIWRKVLAVDCVGRENNFFESGGTSILGAQLIAEVEVSFGHQFTFASILALPTLKALAEEIDHTARGGAAGRSHHLVPLQTRGSLPPFFGMHPLFGLVYPYAELARQLRPERPFFALQARGFAPGEVPHPSIEQMASAYIEAIKQVQPVGPYNIGGWSLGSLIALEVAQQLQRSGQEIARLVIIDQATDSIERFLEQVPVSVQLQRFGGILANAMRSFDRYYADNPGLWNALRRPLKLWRFCRRVFVPMLKIAWVNRAAAIDYVVKPYAGRIFLLHTGDPEFTNIQDPRLGWDKIARDGVVVSRIPGTHLTLHEPPYVYELAERLSEALVSNATAQ